MRESSDELRSRPFWLLSRSYEAIPSFSNGIISNYRKLFDSMAVPFAIGSLMTFLVAITCAYSLLFPNFNMVVGNGEVRLPDKPARQIEKSADECDVFEGRWVEDESYPLYKASDCPFAERGFNCLSNGRKDNRYTKWRWKPKDCDIPRFNASAILEHLRGKRIVFVGDSLSRTQWESSICLLMTGVKDKKTVYEVNRHKIAKNIPFLGVRFSSFNISIDFYRSVFLVQTGWVPKHAPKRVKMTLRLDKLDRRSHEWVDSDVLVFNSGHWWSQSRLFYDMKCYFQIGDSLKLGMSVHNAYRRALETWASWADKNINRNRTSVFFRTFESTHWRGKNGHQCQVTNRPSSTPNGFDRSPFSDIVMDVMKKLTLPVMVMHVTPMGAFRADGHVGTWNDNPSVHDCSHWCLPGVPDMWNEILFSYLLPRKGVFRSSQWEVGGILRR